MTLIQSGPMLSAQMFLSCQPLKAKSGANGISSREIPPDCSWMLSPRPHPPENFWLLTDFWNRQRQNDGVTDSPSQMNASVPIGEFARWTH